MNKMTCLIPTEKELRKVIKDILNFSSKALQKKEVVKNICQQLELSVPLLKDVKQKLDKRTQNALNDLVEDNEVSSEKVRSNLRIYKGKMVKSDLVRHQSRLKFLSIEKELLNKENNEIDTVIELTKHLNARLTNFTNDKELTEDLKIEIMSLDKDIRERQHKVNAVKLTIQLIKNRLRID